MPKNRKDSFWIGYSDLMTSLFFIMMVLFIVLVVKMKRTNNALNTANASKEHLEMILKLDKQFEELNKSSELAYDEEKKIFIAKRLTGIEIFTPYKDVIKQEYLSTVDKVGESIQTLINNLYKQNPQLSFQLVIEGTAAIPYKELVAKTFDPDNTEMYELSYKRALALYKRWRSKGLDFRKYNTEVMICGNGFNGNNRDKRLEDNNKRFIIQIIPKISRPKI